MPRPSSESLDLVEGTLIAGKYRVDARLGRGGMGTVYRAVHQTTGRRVALKWMHKPTDELRDRMQREALALGAIEHPNVVQILDAGEHEGSFFLVMELLRGETLREHAAGRPRAIDASVDLLIAVMQGVEAAHRAGLVHRDLKPDNIFVTLDDRGAILGVKVLDFGIARPFDGEHGGSDITRSGSVVGTPRYMAPEQIRGLDVDRRTDVFALGIIAYELLTGRPPFDSERYEALILQIATATPAPPTALVPSLDGALAAAVLVALARAPDERFATVADFARAIEPFGTQRFVEPDARRSSAPVVPRARVAETEGLPPTVNEIPTRRAAPSGGPAAQVPATPAPSPVPPRTVPAAIETPARVPGRRAPRPVLMAAIAAAGLGVFTFATRPRMTSHARRDDGAPAMDARPLGRSGERPVEPTTPPPVTSVPPVASAPADAGVPSPPSDVRAVGRAVSRTSRSAPSRESERTTAPASRPSGGAVEVRGRSGVIRAEDF